MDQTDFTEEDHVNSCTTESTAAAAKPRRLAMMDLSDFTKEDFAIMTPEDWYYLDRCNAELMPKAKEIEAANERVNKTRALANEIEVSFNKLGSGTGSPKISKENVRAGIKELRASYAEIRADFREMRQRNLKNLEWIFGRRRMILDKAYKRMMAQLSDSHRYNYEDYIYEVENANLRTDIQVINQDGGPADQRAAFLHIYGLDYDHVKDKGNKENQKMLAYLFHLCNIRGTTQLKIPFRSDYRRGEMESIRQACDELLSSWDKSSTEYWNLPDIQARIDDIDDQIACICGTVYT